MSVGFVSVPVVPTFEGMSKAFADRLEKPARESGERAGKSISDGLNGAVQNLERQVKASSTKVDELDRAYEKARGKQKVRETEEAEAKKTLARLEAEHAKAVADGSKITESAHKQLSAARVKAVKASNDLRDAAVDATVADRKRKEQLDDLNKTLGKLGDAQKEASAEVGKSKGVFASFRDELFRTNEELDKTGEKTLTLGDKIMSGLGKVGTGALLGVGAKIGATVVGSINTAFDKGFGRLQSIEQAETMLGGLGHSAEGIAEIMDNAMDSVSGTAYGFGEAASMAATFAGAGIEQGEELTRILSLVGDSAAITGADFQEMGSIWTKMASSGKLSTDEMNQLMDRGLGLLPKLQEHYNVTADEARKMVSDGKVSFQDFAEIMENMVGGSSQAMGDTFSGSAANMQAALGRLGAKFMDPIYEVAPSIFQAIGGSVDKLGEYLGPVIEDFAERFAPVMQDFAERLGPWLEESIDKAAASIKGLVDWGRQAVEWMKDNQTWLEPLAVGVAAMAASWGAWTLAIKGYNAATKIAAAVTLAFDKVTKKTIFGAIAAAIIGVVSALVYFFTQTETGQKMWETFTTALADGWDWVTEKIGAGIDWIQGAWSSMAAGFQTAYDGFIKPVFDGFVTAGQVLVAVIGTAVLTPILLGWKLLSAGIQLYWETVVKPTLDAFAALGTWLWESALQPVFTAISDGWAATTGRLSEAWQAVSDTFLGVWETIKSGVFDAWNSYTEMVRQNWVVIAAALSAAWQAVGDFFANTWNWIKSAVFDAFTATVEWVRDKFLNDTGLIGSYFRLMADGLGVVKDFIVGTVFGGLGSGLDTVKSWFQAAVDGIGKIWDGLKAVAARPVKFVVDTVWNNGILAAWNVIADFLPGIDEKAPIALGDLGKYANGGTLPGYSPGVDNFEFIEPRAGLRIGLGGGESIMVPEWTRAMGGPAEIDRQNKLAREGKLNPVGGHGPLGMWDVGAFASGGVIGAMMDIVRAKYGNVLQMTSGQRPGGGMHGAGLATDWSNGFGNTPEQLALAHDIAQTYPGAAELIYDSPGWSGNIKNGQNVGAFGQFYTLAQAGRHDHHVHWGMTTPPTMQFGGGVFEGGSSSGGIGAAVVNWVADRVRGIWSEIVEPLKDSILGKVSDFGDSAFAQIPMGMFTSLKDAAWSKLSSLFGQGGGSDSGSVDVSDISGAVVDQVEAVFARHGFTGQQWEDAKWIVQQESSWSPTAVNPSSGAFGLFQFNPMGGNTLGAYLPDRNTTPAVQADAGARYMKDRYGDPTAARRFWEANGWYADGGVFNPTELFTRDLGGWVPNGALVRNTSGRDELMLPPELSQAMTGFFNDYPEAASSLADAAVSIETASEWLAQAADYSSSEGAVARAVTRGILGIGIDLPGADLVSGFLDAEEAIWESRLKYSKHIDTIAEKEKALAEALEALDELGSGDGELGTKDQRKIDDATAKVEEAKADLAKADSDEKRAKAAEKLADAEEKLRRVREDLDESAAKDAKKHAEDITKANEAVAKAESELVEAKRQQASDLHAITILSQDSLAGMESQAAGLANQLIGLGAPAAAVTQGLGAVSGVLGSVAGMAGPAGLTLGMALDIAKSVIQLVQMLEQMWKEIVEKITTYRTALLTGQADFLSGIAEINSLVSDQKMEIVSLANEWVDATLRMRDAIRGITEAAVGVLSANLEGAKAIADIQKKILDARSGSGGSGSSGGSAFTDLHDMGLLYDSHADRLTATPRIKSSDGGSSGGSVSDIAASVDEIAALEWELIAAEKNHSIMLIDAMIGMVDAQFEQIQATRDLERLEADRDRAWARLLQMQEIQTQFAINEQQAIVQEQINELLRQNAEAESVLLDPMNRLADLLDVDGDGTFFGLFTNKGSIAVQAAQNTIAANNAQIEKLMALQAPYGGPAEITPEMQATLEKAARLFAEGMDREAQWLLDSSALGDPARALQIIDLSERLAAIDNDNLALEREWEDLELRLDHIEATEGLESLREGLQHDREYALASAEILRATSDEVRKAAEALRDYHAQAAAQKPTVVTVNVPPAGTVVDADVLDQTLTQLGQQLDGVEIRTERLESAGKPTGGSVLVSKS